MSRDLHLYLPQAFPLFSGFQDTPFPKVLWSRLGSLWRESLRFDVWR